MIVVSNSSPIIHLEKVGKLNILKELFTAIYIPEAVFNEVYKGTNLSGKKPEWIVVENVEDRTMTNFFSNTLGIGESEAIVLAVEKKSDLLLIDDYRAREQAKSMGITITGIAGILITAKEKNMIKNVKKILDELIASDFRISKSLYENVLIKAGEEK